MCLCVSAGGEKNLPDLAGGKHTKIANGSQLIEINYSSNQGRFLQVDTLQYHVYCL